MDMLSNCTKDAGNGFHKSATKKQFYDKSIYEVCLKSNGAVHAA